MVKEGDLIRVSSFQQPDEISGPNVVKLYSTLAKLRNKPFMAFDRVLVIAPKEEAFVTIVVEVADFQYANKDLRPMAEAVKIIYDTQAWWMFSYDIESIVVTSPAADL